MTLDSSQNAFLSIAPITYLLPVPKGRPDGASLVTDGWRRPEVKKCFERLPGNPKVSGELTANRTLQAVHRNDSLGGVTDHTTIRHARIYLLPRSRVYIYCRTYI
jgi:hypothetical protein